MLPPDTDLQLEFLSWQNIDALIDHLLPQFRGEFDAVLIIARGGLVPGGYLAEIMRVETVLTTSVHCGPVVKQKLTWPAFTQFPDDSLLKGQRVLVVDDIWAHGVNMVVVKERAVAAGAEAETAVLHYRPRSSLFAHLGPDYYGAITDRYIVYPWESSFLFQPPPGGSSLLSGA